MVKVLRYGKMEQNIQANGKMVKHMDMVFSFMCLEISMKVTGNVIKLMAMESSPM